MSKETDNYATPKWILELLFPDGLFFDPCPIGVEFKEGTKTDGLCKVWPKNRTVFINPPFSNPLPWVRKASKHKGPIVLLLPVDPTTKWWTYSHDFKITLIGSRLHFNECATYARQTLCIWRRL